MEESIRTLVETKFLMGERGSYQLEKTLEGTQMPATVQAVLAARIDRLTPEEKRVLQSAAVVGKDVPFVLLQTIADQSEEELRRGLSRLQAAEQIMPLEDAIRKLTFIPASLFGLYDRGLVRQGVAADRMVFDAATIRPLEPGEAHDLPGGAKRRKQLAREIEMTVVNGQVLIEKGEHTGADPGKVARSAVLSGFLV